MSPADRSLISHALRALAIVIVSAMLIYVAKYAVTPTSTPYYAMIASHRAADLQSLEIRKQESNDTTNSGTGSK